VAKWGILTTFGADCIQILELQIKPNNIRKTKISTKNERQTDVFACTEKSGFFSGFPEKVERWDSK
jgi:hypothetical protein